MDSSGRIHTPNEVQNLTPAQRRELGLEPIPARDLPAVTAMSGADRLAWYDNRRARRRKARDARRARRENRKR